MVRVWLDALVVRGYLTAAEVPNSKQGQRWAKAYRRVTR